MELLAPAWPLVDEDPDAHTLDDLKPGQRARIRGIAGTRDARRRLLEMGLCRDVVVQLVRRAPLGDPLEFRIRGYLLSLRSVQARLVSVAVEDR